MVGPSGVNNAAGAAARRAERDAHIWQMSLSGYTERQIGVEVGLSQARVSQIITRAIESRVRRPAEQIVERELAKLDDWETWARRVLEARHVMIRGDGVVMEPLLHPQTGVPLLDPDTAEPLMRAVEDDMPILAALDRLVKVQERRAKLTGMDAPAKSEVQANFSYTINGEDITGSLR